MHVLVVEVGIGRVENGWRRREPDALPLKAPVERPAQDASPFRLELVGKILVPLMARDRDAERDEVHAASDSFVDAAEAGFVVAGDEQFELRHKLEKILPHKARADRITAGERFDL